MTGAPVEAIAAIAPREAVQAPIIPPAPSVNRADSFAKMVFDGVDHVNQKALASDAIEKAFITDDTIPPHQVMFALEQSRLSLELLMQVRNRLVEGYQEIMRMQL